MVQTEKSRKKLTMIAETEKYIVTEIHFNEKTTVLQDGSVAVGCLQCSTTGCENRNMFP
jgi:hypothetical protein